MQVDKSGRPEVENAAVIPCEWGLGQVGHVLEYACLLESAEWDDLMKQSHRTVPEGTLVRVRVRRKRKFEAIEQSLDAVQ